MFKTQKQRILASAAFIWLFVSLPVAAYVYESRGFDVLQMMEYSPAHYIVVGILPSLLLLAYLWVTSNKDETS